MAAAGVPAGRREKASSPNCFRIFRSASFKRKRRWPPFSTRQWNFSFRISVRAVSEKAPSFTMASAGENRPSSLTTCSARSLPVKLVRWALPVVMSQKAAPAERASM